MSSERDTAVGLLVHYMMHAGLPTEHDTREELGALVDHIIQAAVDEVFQTPAMRQLLAEHV